MMRTLIALAAVLLLAAILVALLLHWSEQDQRRLLDETYIALEADRAEREAALEAQYAAYRAQMTVAVQTALVGLLLMGAGAGAAVLARLAWGYASGERAQLRLAELALAAGRDVSVADLNNRHPMPIAHFAPSLHIAPRVTTQPTAELPAPDVAIGNVPTFAELLSAGKVGKGTPLLLGITDGRELAGDWRDLYSTAVGGLPGTGKTTSQRFFAAQVALHGAKFVCVDPHYGSGDDSLGATLQPLLPAVGLCDIASEHAAILEAVKMVDDLGQRRVSGRDSDTTPIILWVDELTGLLGHSQIGPQLALLLEKIAQQYRKRGVYASCSGQIWTAARTSSELRDSFASVLAHRMKRSQARLLLPTDEAGQVERLPTGTALLWRTSGQTNTVAIPQTTAADVRHVAGLLTGSAPTMPRLHDTPDRSQNEAALLPDRKPDGSQIVAIDDPATTAPQCGMSVSAEAARVRALFLGGKTLAEIVYDVRGVKSNQGGRYQSALMDVQDLLRDALS